MSTVNAPAPVLRLPAAVRDSLVEASRLVWPEEACGFLAGRQDGGALVVTRARVCANRAGFRVRERYEISPADCLAAHLDARARDEEVLGVWHSHPGGACRPSVIDLGLAWEGWVYLIVGQPEEADPALAAWWRCEAGFLECALEP